MRRSLAFLFLTCSFILILGHSILPHNHLEERYPKCKISEVKKLSFSDIILLTLAHDLGVRHLEEYKNCNPQKYVYSDSQLEFMVYESPSFSFVAFISQDRHLVWIEPTLALQDLLYHSGLRAPPRIS